MSLTTKILIIILIVLVFIRTMSYVVWNWKNENKFGSVMVLSVSIASVALPLYTVFFRT